MGSQQALGAAEKMQMMHMLPCVPAGVGLLQFSIISAKKEDPLE